MFFLLVLLIMLMNGARAMEQEDPFYLEREENPFSPKRIVAIPNFKGTITILPYADCIGKKNDFSRSPKELEKAVNYRIEEFTRMEEIMSQVKDPSLVNRYVSLKNDLNVHLGNLCIYAVNKKALSFLKELLKNQGVKDFELFWKEESIEKNEQKGTIEDYIKLCMQQNVPELTEYLQIVESMPSVEPKP